MNRYVVAGAAFVAAISAGYVMQNGFGGGGHGPTQLAAAQPVTAQSMLPIPAAPAPSAPVVLSDISHVSALPEEGVNRAAAEAAPEAPAVVPALVPAMDTAAAAYDIALAEDPAPAKPTLGTPVGELMEPIAKPAPDTTPTDTPAEAASDKDAAAPVCEVALQAEQRAAAMVHLVLDAPCLPNERVTFHHSGLMFTLATDADGHLEAEAPALTETALYIASFAAGDSAVAMVDVDSLIFYDRAVVQWKGAEGLHLHALEYGAHYGEAGHVWADAPRDLTVAARGEGGFLTKLGDPSIAEAQLAEVYTFPTATAAREGDIDLSVEAEVTAANCAQELDAQSLQVHEGAAPVVQDLVLDMPECSAAGDYLLLKNLVNDLKIARN
ncbi:hypothetical protein [Pseudooceanicola nanhaiensis]|uniref:hypothetical protein n=1 Tax=Pseudooceanicola nanhaiensis TaxID=375761 RepID=UPI001CD7DB76|nr:hypothetical protein [Pseudooceanicola nanhaiensis]MCA0920321.1 hypothetical protein [Pseudooceanicola nanhaiensis]